MTTDNNAIAGILTHDYPLYKQNKSSKVGLSIKMTFIIEKSMKTVRRVYEKNSLLNQWRWFRQRFVEIFTVDEPMTRCFKASIELNWTSILNMITADLIQYLFYLLTDVDSES